MRVFLLLSTLCLSGCASSSAFMPKSAYPPDPWVKGYSDPDDCIGGEQLAALKFDLPAYPKGSFRSGQQGWTIVRLDVAETGFTENVRIERSVPSGQFDRASVKAVEAWQFRPPSAALSDCRILIRYRTGETSLGA